MTFANCIYDKQMILPYPKIDCVFMSWIGSQAYCLYAAEALIMVSDSEIKYAPKCCSNKCPTRGKKGD